MLFQILKAAGNLVLAVVLFAGVFALWPIIKTAWVIVTFLLHLIPC